MREKMVLCKRVLSSKLRALQRDFGPRIGDESIATAKRASAGFPG
ncbi:hypothetical protein RTCIAT899_PA00020 (plasmid) [Rhizobium tropici CIAT 899]|nr:hypothetical protein RTCIAT899_PA00020 [Rhizobium tropici CIAT 899]